MGEGGALGTLLLKHTLLSDGADEGKGVGKLLCLLNTGANVSMVV
jgi:hypothetical protein